MKLIILLFCTGTIVLSTFISRSQSVTFNHTGAMQTWIVPPCVTSIDVIVAGAKGGGSNGGSGARITGTFTVTPGQTLFIFCGGMGISGNNSGGFNGGGTGHSSTDGNTSYDSWGGGGASDIRFGGTALANRVIVAGGGGGRSGGSAPVCGGPANCTDGADGCSTFGAGGLGGTAVSGGNGGTPWNATPPGGSPGALGLGGAAGVWQTASGGGGGGGYYGGGGGGNDGCCTGANGGGGGGGGSSLVPPGGSCLPANNNGHGFVTINYIPASELFINTSVVQPTCFGDSDGSLDIDVSGGVLDYNISWTGPSVGNPAGPEITVSGGHFLIPDLAAGNYGLTISDAGGCVENLTVTINQPTQVIVDLVSSPVLCNGDATGSLAVQVSNGSPGYSLQWSGVSSGDPLGTEIPTSGGIYPILNLTAGSITVVATDVNNCSSSATAIISEPALLVASNSTVSTVCYGSSDGSATIAVNGGVNGYNLSWVGPSSGNPAGLEISNNGGNFTISNISAGSYNVVVTDVNNCVTNTTAIISQPPLITNDAFQTVCYLDLPYTWNNVVFNSAGNQTTTLQSIQGCDSILTMFLTVDSPTVTVSATSTLIDSEQETMLIAVGSPPGGNFSWSPVNSLENALSDITIATPTNTTVYTVTYSINDCPIENNLTIIVNPDKVIYYIPNTFTPDGDGFNQLFQPIFFSGISKDDFSLCIYNRWGELIFKSLDPEWGWDGSFGTNGKKVQEGTYSYKIKYKLPDVDEYREISGHVNLIR